ncbi:hypothetical protein BJF79_18380 [Actinomadura sp. CNU-125]|nr:hypothetical protein BJF79_18380 [Actinomadura sp. CNU-125]
MRQLLVLLREGAGELLAALDERGASGQASFSPALTFRRSASIRPICFWSGSLTFAASVSSLSIDWASSLAAMSDAEPSALLSEYGTLVRSAGIRRPLSGRDSRYGSTTGPDSRRKWPPSRLDSRMSACIRGPSSTPASTLQEITTLPWLKSGEMSVISPTFTPASRTSAPSRMPPVPANTPLTV